MPTKKLPTPTTIDQAAAAFTELKRLEAEAAAETESAKVVLIEMVQKYGSSPARSGKSLRLEGKEFQITVSQSQSTSIDQAAVKKLKDIMANNGWGRGFRHLFHSETKFTLNPESDQNAADYSAAIQRLFRGCIKVKAGSPQLKVETKEKAAVA